MKIETERAVIYNTAGANKFVNNSVLYRGIDMSKMCLIVLTFF